MTRAFIVGNGPSLNATNLDKLNGEVTFAVNNVHRIYPKTSWRPQYYVRAEQAFGLDPEAWLESMQTHLELGCQIYCNDYFFRPRFGLKQTDRVHIIRACSHYQRHYDDQNAPHLWHLPMLCTFGSTVNVATQIAVQIGFSPIYLVGCDLGYKDGSPSHFDDEYEHGQEQEAKYANLDTLLAHMIAKRSSNTPIYNATVGGELEVYERVDFDETLDNR